MKLECKEIEGRYSCRFYNERELVTKDVIETIIYSASLAPSGKNLQPWRFHILEDKNKIKKIAALLDNSKWLKRVNQAIIILVDLNDNYDIIKTSMSIGACIQNILLEAYSHDIATCWVSECMELEDIIKDELNIEKKLKLMAIIPIGYCKYKLKQPPKKNINELIV